MNLTNGWMGRGAVSILGAIACVFSGCVQYYKPPTASEPHAVVKLRRSYHRVAGTTLRELASVDDNVALQDNTASGLGREPRTDSILVHPVPATIAVSNNFSHTEVRTVQESYTVQVPHTEMESYDCSTGFGTNRSYRTCTRPVTRYRPETKYRTVTKPVEVSDGSCNGRTRFTPKAGRTYLVQYSYHDHSVCSISCYEQESTGNGQFRNHACPAAPPAED